MNILIVEDDQLLVGQIQKTFKKHGFINRICHIGSYREYLLCSPQINTFDLVLLDINLWMNWQENWFFLLSAIRKNNITIPVVIISSHNEYWFLEKAFALWANDYVIKPFRNRELQIRIQRWFRHYIFSEYFSINNTLNYWKLRYDISAYEFFICDKKMILTKWSKYLFSLFVVHREKILTRDFLINKIWWFSEEDYEKNLRIKIMRLKSILKLYGMDDWIKTIRWEWYLFEANI